MAWGKSDQQQSSTPPVLHPVDRARAAFDNGDRFFQAQLIVNELLTLTPSLTKTDSTVHETEGIAHILGDIESIGWRLEHVGYTFMEKAAITGVYSSRTATWSAGQTIGIYLFRRAGMTPLERLAGE
jgi:hypothetical protein